MARKKKLLTHRLGSDLTIRTAAAARAALTAVLDVDAPLTLQAANLEHVDTAGVQLLCAFAQARHAAGRPLAWDAPSPALTAAAAALGLTAALRLGPTG